MIMLEQLKERLLTSGLAEDEVGLVLALYGELPYTMRQQCAEQMMAEPSLAQLFVALRQNEKSFLTEEIDGETFLQNEQHLLTNYVG